MLIEFEPVCLVAEVIEVGVHGGGRGKLVDLLIPMA
jgi:hypothetical protein